MKFGIVFISFSICHVTYASLFDYVLSFARSKPTEENNNDYDIVERNIPYEVNSVDEKFISEAVKLSGVELSKLDACQHRVVLRLQTTCDKMNDDQVAKLAVMLLNCQSAIEGRPLYACSESMTLRECTSNMDADVWNTYHIMTNRARAVCYTIRQSQFRGLTEMTVNKLMRTAHSQLQAMAQLTESQQKLEEATQNSIKTVNAGHEALKAQQADIRKAQLVGQLAIEENIQQLVKEKALIKAGHQQISKLTQDMKNKLDNAALQIKWQSTEQKNNHHQVLEDLISIQRQAENIWQRIEESSNHILKQTAQAAQQYEITLAQLSQVNDTVSQLFNVITSSQEALDKKFAWLSEILGGTGTTIDKLYACLVHIAFLLIAMLICAFLNIPIASRYALVVLVPLNLILALQHGPQHSLQLPILACIIVTFTIVHHLSMILLRLVNNSEIPQMSIKWFKSTTLYMTQSPPKHGGNITPIKETIPDCELRSRPGMSLYSDGNAQVLAREADLPPGFNSTNDCMSPTPPHSRNGFYSPRSRSRSGTPLMARPGISKEKCVATTRSGLLCKNAAMFGRDFCYRHQLGSSMIGE